MNNLADNLLSEKERCDVIAALDALDDERAAEPMYKLLANEQTPEVVKVNIAICLGNHRYQPSVPYIIDFVLHRSPYSGSLLWALKGQDYSNYLESLVDILATDVYECSNKCMLLIKDVALRLDSKQKNELIERLQYYLKIYASGGRPESCISVDISSNIAFIEETISILGR
jgi:hypothetical protein